MDRVAESIRGAAVRSLALPRQIETVETYRERGHTWPAGRWMLAMLLTCLAVGACRIVLGTVIAVTTLLYVAGVGR
jgi:hypothetical protein